MNSDFWSVYGVFALGIGGLAIATLVCSLEVIIGLEVYRKNSSEKFDQELFYPPRSYVQLILKTQEVNLRKKLVFWFLLNV